MFQGLSKTVVLAGIVLAGALPVEAMTIQINAGAGLLANPLALAAFQRAAGAWDTIFSDPITVNISADLVSFGNPGIVGTNDPVFAQLDYSDVRNRLVADSAGQADKETLISALPTAAQFSAALPAGFSYSGLVSGTKANLKAMGFGGLDALFGANDATLTMNSDYPFFYGTGVVPPAQVDFTTAATREIGYALGFVSAVDNVDIVPLGGPVAIDVLDWYRFASATLPTDLASFSTVQRSLKPGVAAVFDDLAGTHAFSTGMNFGDGGPAGSWKDDALTGNYVGIFDPTTPPGARQAITPADIRALALLGYDVAPPEGAPEPGTIVLMLGGLAGLGFWKRRRGQATQGDGLSPRG